MIEKHGSLIYGTEEEIMQAIRNKERHATNINERVLEQIRAEIEQAAKVYHEVSDYGRECGLQTALEIIDKYTKGDNK